MRRQAGRGLTLLLRRRALDGGRSMDELMASRQRGSFAEGCKMPARSVPPARYRDPLPYLSRTAAWSGATSARSVRPSCRSSTWSRCAPADVDLDQFDERPHDLHLRSAPGVSRFDAPSRNRRFRPPRRLGVHDDGIVRHASSASRFGADCCSDHYVVPLQAHAPAWIRSGKRHDNQVRKQRRPMCNTTPDRR